MASLGQAFWISPTHRTIPVSYTHLIKERNAVGVQGAMVGLFTVGKQMLLWAVKDLVEALSHWFWIHGYWQF